MEQKLKFSYHGVIGELLYSFIIIHVGIGNTIQFLSKFLSSLHLDHYLALKNACHYLRKHKSKGLIYWHTCPVQSLPHVPFEIKVAETQLPPFPNFELTELVAFANAVYATDSKTQCSISRYIIVYAGTAIAYKAKMQPTIATSLTEAEFIAVYAAKAIKHLHSVLHDLGLPQLKSTVIYEDNKAAIDMINNSKHTTELHHIDVQHFAIQEWQSQGGIEMCHIPGILNLVDDKTKALSRMLHSCHSCHAMGHYGPSHSGRE